MNLPQNGTIGFDPQPFIKPLKKVKISQGVEYIHFSFPARIDQPFRWASLCSGGIFFGRVGGCQKFVGPARETGLVSFWAIRVFKGAATLTPTQHGVRSPDESQPGPPLPIEGANPQWLPLSSSSHGLLEKVQAVLKMEQGPVEGKLLKT